MKKMNKKTLVLLIAIAALMTASIGGTVAWLATSSGPITNTFTPAEVQVQINEDFTNGVSTVKKNVSFTNPKTERTVDCYIRAAVVGNWYDAQRNIVAPWTGSIGTPGENWVPGSDGYYYYTEIVNPGGKTTDLIGSTGVSGAQLPAGVPAGAHLELTVLAQAIQADGGAVTVGANGGWTITNPTAN